jgi:hypothetical protein
MVSSRSFESAANISRLTQGTSLVAQRYCVRVSVVFCVRANGRLRSSIRSFMSFGASTRKRDRRTVVPAVTLHDVKKSPARNGLSSSRVYE